MVAITWSDEAKQHLKDIHAYIARENTNAAKSIARGIVEKAYLLTTHPNLGKLRYEDENGQVRITLYKKYRIAYLLNSSKDILIVGLFHSAMDIDRLLP